MTFRQMIDKVTLDAGVLGNEMFPEAYIKEVVNQANRSIQVKLNGLGLEKWATSTTPSVATATWAGNNVCYISTPSDFLEGDNEINATTTASDGTVGFAKKMGVDMFQEALRNTYQIPTTRYPAFARMDNKFYFFPRVTSMTFRYRKVVPTLSSDSDTSEIPLEYHDLVVAKAVLEIKKAKENQMFIIEDQKLDKDVEDTYIKSIRNDKETQDDARGN